MKFINKKTGVILETSNDFVIEQYKKDKRLEEMKPPKKTKK